MLWCPSPRNNDLDMREPDLNLLMVAVMKHSVELLRPTQAHLARAAPPEDLRLLFLVVAVVAISFKFDGKGQEQHWERARSLDVLWLRAGKTVLESRI
jgi:hypothetical protein